MTVLISDYFEYYRLAAYLSLADASERIGIVMGVPSLTSCSTKNITRNCPAGFLRTSAGSSKTI